METITLTLCDNRTGTASGYVGGLALETYQFKGRDVPDGTRVALLTPDGRTLAAATVQGGAAEVDTDTQEVADLLRYQPVGAEAQVHIAIGDEDSILAIVPAKMRKNWLDDSVVHPPAPLPDYWTSEQTRDAIAEALKGYATQAWVDEQLTKKQDTIRASSSLSLMHLTASGTVAAKKLTQGGTALDDLYGSKATLSATTQMAQTAQSNAAKALSDADSAKNAASAADTKAGTALTTAQAAQTTAEAAMPKSGGTFTGGLNVMGTVTASALAEGGQALADKYADKAHTHAQGDVTGLTAALAAKQDALIPGEGIDLCGNVISATGGGGLPNTILVADGYPTTVGVAAQKYVVIGAGASGSQCSVVVGVGGRASDGGVALGEDASAGEDSVASGRGANAGNYGVAIGHIAYATISGVAVGNYAFSQTKGVAVGQDTTARNRAVAIGQTAKAYSDDSVAIGTGANSLAEYGLAIGIYARACQYSVALGSQANAGRGLYGKSIAIGFNAWACDEAIAIGTGTSVYSQSYGNLALGDSVYVGPETGYENAAIGYGAVVDGVCTYRAAVLGARGYTNISGGTVLSASDYAQTLTLQLYLVACRELCKYGVIGLTMTDWLTGETCGVYTGADAFMRALNGTPWTGAFGGGCCACAA